MEKPRSLTSAVPGMSVSDMRRCLSEVRALLSDQTSKKPFNMKHELSNGMELWNFVHKVAIGLYQKRSKNRKKSRVDDDSGSSEEE
jgi:hypothetical protein